MRSALTHRSKQEPWPSYQGDLGKASCKGLHCQTWHDPDGGPPKIKCSIPIPGLLENSRPKCLGPNRVESDEHCPSEPSPSAYNQGSTQYASISKNLSTKMRMTYLLVAGITTLTIEGPVESMTINLSDCTDGRIEGVSGF